MIFFKIKIKSVWIQDKEIQITKLIEQQTEFQWQFYKMVNIFQIN